MAAYTTRRFQQRAAEPPPSPTITEPETPQDMLKLLVVDPVEL